MSIHIADGVIVYIGGYETTCDVNKVGLGGKAESKDSTTMCAGANGHWRTMVPGLKTLEANLEGFWQSDASTTPTIDYQAWANLGASSILTEVPEGATAGNVSAFCRLLETDYHHGATVGEINAFTLSGGGATSEGIIGGRLFLPNAARTSTGTSGIINIPGGVAAGHSLYAALHVFSKSGTSPTLDVTVKSAALVGFGSPTTRITFPTQNAAGAAWGSSATTTTDAYYRVDWSIGGSSTPTFAFAVSVGIA